MPATVGIEPTTFGKVVGSIPTVAMHIFQTLPGVDMIYTQSNIITSILGADYMVRASPVNRAEKCHENLPWAAK